MKQIDNTQKTLDFFMGTITPSGFRGCTEELRAELSGRLVLVKGTPGGGKSRLLHALCAHEATQRLQHAPQSKGEGTHALAENSTRSAHAQAAVQEKPAQSVPMLERLHCAGKPERLDGVVFAAHGVAVVDASAPHTAEPTVPVACEQVLCLYHALCAAQLHPHAEDIAALFAQNECLQRRAARYIASVSALMLDSRRAASCAVDFDKARRYAANLCARLLPKQNTAAREKIRFLSAFTPTGAQIYTNTIAAVATTVIVFADEGGAASRVLLETIRAQALARGYEIITCPCALHPEDKIDHILIPSAGIAFVTCNAWHTIDVPNQQNVHCTRFCDKEKLRAVQQRLRFNKKAAKTLSEQAISLLAQAQETRDAIEGYYAAAMDFAKVEAEGARLAKELFGA